MKASFNGVGMIGRLTCLFRQFPALGAFFLGAVAAFGMAPHFAWYALLPALAAFGMLVRGSINWKRAALIGWAFGVGHFSVGLFWIAHAFVYQEEMPLWVGWFAPIGLSLYLAFFPALCAAASRAFGDKSLTGFAFIFSSFWVCSELLRGFLLTGFPWNPLAAGFVAVTDSSRWIGTYGTSGLVVLAAMSIPLALRRQWRAVASIAVLLIVLSISPRLTAAALIKKVAQILVVQPNIGQQDKYRDGYDEVNFARLAKHTQPASSGRLIFWPEAAVPYVLETDEGARRKISKLMGEGDVLFTGADSYAFNENGGLKEAFNSVVVMDAGQNILARYDKAHLVPGGEYLPLRSVLEPLGLQNLAPGGDFNIGPGPRTLTVKRLGQQPIRVGFMICYEIIFPGAVLYGPNRPDVIFNPSNDAWYGWWQPAQHLAMSQLRAMELGIPVIRSTPTGISSIISADGEILAALPMQKDGAIAVTLPPSRRATLFAQYGNALTIVFAFILSGIGIALGRRVR